MDEVYALQLRAAGAYSHGSMIVASDKQKSVRSPQGIAALQKIHEELVTQRSDDELPVLSGKTYYSPAKPMGLQKILLAFKKFKKFSTREQYKALEATLSEFKSAFQVERTDYVKSSFDLVQGFYASTMTSLSSFYQSRVQPRSE